MISGWINALWTFQGIELTDELRMVFSAFVQLNPLLKFFGHVHIGVNSFNRALVHTCIAVYASFRIDVKPIGKFMKGVYGTNSHTCGVFAVHAFLSYDIGHGEVSWDL